MNDQIHELWLIYNELKEMDTGDSVYLSQRLGEVINQLNRLPAERGAKGGAVKSEAKREASRDNGAKGGRPRKPRCVYCERKDCGCGDHIDGVMDVPGYWLAEEASGTTPICCDCLDEHHQAIVEQVLQHVPEDQRQEKWCYASVGLPDSDGGPPYDHATRSGMYDRDY
jgi:hypothetical protein